MCIAFQNKMTSSSQNSAPSALCHDMWQDGTIKTTNTSNVPCMWVCVCVHVHFDWTMTQKKKYVVNMLEQRLMHYKTCPMASLWELWINQRLRVLAKEAIKYDFLNVPLRLNTSLRWTIWLIPRVFNVSRFRCNAMTHVLALSATVRRNERLWRNLDIGKIIGATFGFQNS